jgi:hypothetical protein
VKYITIEREYVHIRNDGRIRRKCLSGEDPTLPGDSRSLVIVVQVNIGRRPNVIRPHISERSFDDHPVVLHADRANVEQEPISYMTLNEHPLILSFPMRVENVRSHQATILDCGRGRDRILVQTVCAR